MDLTCKCVIQVQENQPVTPSKVSGTYSPADGPLQFGNYGSYAPDGFRWEYRSVALVRHGKGGTAGNELLVYFSQFGRRPNLPRENKDFFLLPTIVI
jgi:hypothetical protein